MSQQQQHHHCYIALVTKLLPKYNYFPHDTFLVRSDDNLEGYEDVHRFNFCPACGKPIDWAALSRDGTLADENPRLRILDMVSSDHPLPVVNVLEEEGGTILLIGDDTNF